MDARTIENVEARFNSAEITELTTQWKEIVKPGIYRMTGGDGNATMNPNSFAMKGESQRNDYNNLPVINNQKTFDKLSDRNTNGAINHKPVTPSNGQWIHSGKWIDQPQCNNSNRTNPAHFPHRSPWKKVRSTQKQTKTLRS